MKYSLACWLAVSLLCTISCSMLFSFPNDPVLVLKESSSKELKNVVDILREDFPEFYALLEKSHSIEVIRNMDYVTVLVPTWYAFRKMDSRTLQDIEQDPDSLKRFVNGHIMQGRILSSQLQGLSSIPTLNTPVYVQKQGETLFINSTAANSPRIVSLDIPAKNGVIHAISKVIIPQTDRIISGYKNNNIRKR